MVTTVFPQLLIVLAVIIAIPLNFCLLLLIRDLLDPFEHRYLKVIYKIFCVIVVLSTIALPFAKWVFKASPLVLHTLECIAFSPLILGVIALVGYLVFMVIAIILLVAVGYSIVGARDLNYYAEKLKAKIEAKKSDNLAPSSGGGLLGIQSF